MSYNDKFINDYNEQTYIKFLSDESLLNFLLNNYNNRYYKNASVDGNYILVQESLNHYVVKKLKSDPSFSQSKYFLNYKKYLQKAISYNNSFFFHNIFFQLFNHNELNILLGNDLFNQIKNIANNKIDKVKNINDKIDKGIEITQQELNLICDVYAFNRDIDNQYHKKLIEYIFKQLTDGNSSLICSEYVLDAILSFIPKNYPQLNGFNALNSRVIADDVHVKNVGISHGQSHVFLERKLFKNTNFKSIDDSKKTYVKRGNDFTFLFVVANHELAHQYQHYMSHKKDFSNEGYMMLKRAILDMNLNDYKDNHDNDDIEIDATEKSWEICSNFFKNYLPDTLIKNQLLNQCRLNIQGTSNRKFDYMKKDGITGTISYTPFYDVSHLNNIIYNNPEYVNRYPMLQTFYNKNGDVSLDFLKTKNICNQSVGSDYISFMCLNYPRKVLGYLKKLNDIELNCAIENITSGFRKFLKPINFYDYNKRNNLSGEYFRHNDRSDYISLLKHYQKSLELYKCIMFIFSDNELSMRQSYLQGNIEVIESSMNHSSTQYEKFKKDESNQMKR